MSSVKERRRNNVKVGVFVTIALMLAVAIIIALTDVTSALSRSTTQYTISFTVASGVSNLKPGAEVRVGGYPMGAVLDVRPDTATQPFSRILVDFDLESDVTLYDNAMILLSTPLLGADAWLDCYSVGDPSTGGAPLAEGGTVTAIESVGLLTTLLGPGNASRAGDIVEGIQETVRNAESLTGRLDDVAGTLQQRGLLNAALGSAREEEADAIVDDLHAAMENSRAVTEDLRTISTQVRTEQWPQWAVRIDELLAWTDSAMQTFDDALEEGRLLFSDVRATVNDNRPAIDSAISNTNAFTERLNTELADKAVAVLDRGHAGLDEATALLQRLREDYEGWSTNVGEALADASLASQQLKLAMIEVRRSPWKVLYRPTQDELEHELLYEATRSFAVAAADMKAASASVARILDQFGDRLDDDPALRERVTRSLLDPLERYEKAQQQLFDVLVMESK